MKRYRMYFVFVAVMIAILIFGIARENRESIATATPAPPDTPDFPATFTVTPSPIPTDRPTFTPLPTEAIITATPIPLLHSVSVKKGEEVQFVNPNGKHVSIRFLGYWVNSPLDNLIVQPYKFQIYVASDMNDSGVVDWIDTKFGEPLNGLEKVSYRAIDVEFEDPVNFFKAYVWWLTLDEVEVEYWDPWVIVKSP